MNQRLLNYIFAATIFIIVIHIICESLTNRKVLTLALENEKLRLDNDNLTLTTAIQEYQNSRLSTESPRTPIGFKIDPAT